MCLVIIGAIYKERNSDHVANFDHLKICQPFNKTSINILFNITYIYFYFL